MQNGATDKLLNREISIGLAGSVLPVAKAREELGGNGECQTANAVDDHEAGTQGELGAAGGGGLPVRGHDQASPAGVNAAFDASGRSHS